MVFFRLRSKNKGNWGTEETFLFILPLLVSHLFSLTKRKVNAIHLNRPNEPLGITEPQSQGYCHLVTKWFFFLLHLLFPALRWQLGDLCLLGCCWWRRRGWLCWWWCCQGRPSPAPRLLTLPHFAFTSHFYASLTTYSVIARFLVLVHDPQHS